MADLLYEPIYNRAANCRLIFENLGVELEGRDVLVAREHQSSFLRWAKDVGVFDPPGLSLDWKLRHHATQRDELLQVLTALQEKLEHSRCKYTSTVHTGRI